MKLTKRLHVLVLLFSCVCFSHCEEPERPTQLVTKKTVPADANTEITNRNRYMTTEKSIYLKSNTRIGIAQLHLNKITMTTDTNNTIIFDHSYRFDFVNQTISPALDIDKLDNSAIKQVVLSLGRDPNEQSNYMYLNSMFIGGVHKNHSFHITLKSEKEIVAKSNKGFALDRRSEQSLLNLFDISRWVNQLDLDSGTVENNDIAIDVIRNTKLRNVFIKEILENFDFDERQQNSVNNPTVIVKQKLPANTTPTGITQIDTNSTPTNTSNSDGADANETLQHFTCKAENCPETGGDYQYTLIHDQRERNYQVHTPTSYKKDSTFAVVFVLHGGGGTIDKMSSMTMFDNKSDQSHFIVVYPQGVDSFTRIDGIQGTWNSGKCCGLAQTDAIDDVGFIAKLIETLPLRFNIDDKRIFVTGISNGGMMAYRLACEISDKIAAIAPVAASMEVDLTTCTPSRGVPVFHFHSKQDENILLEGGVGPNAKVKIEKTSIASGLLRWQSINKCSAPSVKDVQLSNTNVTCTKATANNLQPDCTEVIQCITEDGGHSWPGGNRGSGVESDPVSTAISATDQMWVFFAHHALPKDTN